MIGLTHIPTVTREQIKTRYAAPGGPARVERLREELAAQHEVITEKLRQTQALQAELARVLQDIVEVTGEVRA